LPEKSGFPCAERPATKNVAAIAVANQDMRLIQDSSVHPGSLPVRAPLSRERSRQKFDIDRIYKRLTSPIPLPVNDCTGGETPSDTSEYGDRSASARIFWPALSAGDSSEQKLSLARSEPETVTTAGQPADDRRDKMTNTCSDF
jgi:hypothetical protein